MKIALVAGARPNFMKIAPMIKELDREEIENYIIHTGQHYDFEMSGIFFSSFNLRAPNYNLGIGSGTNNYQTAKAMLGLEKIYHELEPDLVIVVGDVNSTLAGALTAAKMGIKVAHIESGLRSYDRTMPEEINRIMTDAVSELLFTSCKDANVNLQREGIGKEKIYFVGNIMIDTLVTLMPEIDESEILKDLDCEHMEYAYVTLHRPSNVDDKEVLIKIAETIRQIGDAGIRTVFPVHPRTMRSIEDFELTKKFNELREIKLIKPLGYIESIAAMRSARFVLTDSGGVQEETTYLGVPCLTLRPNTERPITIEQGTNILLDKGPSMIMEEVAKILEQGGKEGKIPELWDGNTAKRIVRIINDRLG